MYLKWTAHNTERTLELRPWTLFLVVFLHLENKKTKSLVIN